MLLVLVIIIAVYLICTPELFSIWKGEFTQEGWSDFSWLRYKIIDDMEAKINIWSLSKEKIIDILGPDEGYVGARSNRIISYEIRTRAPILIISEFKYYCIKFADDGKVEDIYIFKPS